MHLVFIARGISHRMELFKEHMKVQIFKTVRKNLKTGKDEVHFLQGALRPIQLFEYIFPENALNEVLYMTDLYKHKEGSWGFSKGKALALRKMLGKDESGNKYTPLPSLTDKEIKEASKSGHEVDRRGVALYPIGIKKDDFKVMKEWGYELEML